MDFQVLLTREGKKWTAEVLALAGCITWGFSREHVLELAKEAIEGWLETSDSPPESSAEADTAVELATVRVG
jgi:predicted RNase H-like HicB family nuclease